MKIYNIFSYTGISRIRIFLNIIRLLFYKLINKRFVIAKIYNNKMLLDLKTLGISQVLFIYNKRELLDVEILMEELEDNMNVLDIGANIGYYAILEASLLDSGRVYAFEPDPRNIEMLKKNIKLNNFSEKIKLYPYAIAEENCIRKFNLTKRTNLSRFAEKEQGLDSIKVKCLKLNDFAKEKNIDFIRMDIEGYECMALAGMIDFLRIKQDLRLLIEVHSVFYDDERFNFKERLEMLEKFGFSVKYLVSAGLSRPKEIINLGYRPIKTVKEGRSSHGLYKDIKMKDLLTFLDNDTKIIRSIFLEKKHENE